MNTCYLRMRGRRTWIAVALVAAMVSATPAQADWTIVDLSNLSWVEPSGSISGPSQNFLRLLAFGTINVVNAVKSGQTGDVSVPELLGTYAGVNVNHNGTVLDERREAMDILDKCGKVFMLAMAQPEKWTIRLQLYSPNLTQDVSANTAHTWLWVSLNAQTDLRCRLVKIPVP